MQDSNQRLSSGAFTGSVREGNPYKGNLEKCISYDKLDSRFIIVEQEDGKPNLVTNYRANAKKLLQYFRVLPSNRVLEIGSGTGITTIELLQKFPDITVTSIEESESMLDIARYKFGLSSGNQLLEIVNDSGLLDYWRAQHLRAEPNKNRVKFILGNFLEINLERESFDAAIAAQSLHWIGLARSFEKLYEFLKSGAELVWNTSSHFYDDIRFPAAKYEFRYNDFIKMVLDEIRTRGIKVKTLEEIFKPEHNFESIRSISSSYGFKTEQVDVQLLPVDFQILLEEYLPYIVKEAIEEDRENCIPDLKTLYNEAVAKTIIDPKALQDTTHKFVINPVFISTKI